LNFWSSIADLRFEFGNTPGRLAQLARAHGSHP
jgi:hypothetical protein